MLSRIWLAYRTVGRTFGMWIAPLLSGLLFCGLRILVFLGMSLDEVVLPRLRQTKIEKPILIVGNPRTGTTFLHRFLDTQGIAAGYRLWGMLWPSVLVRKFIKPFLPILEKISPARHHSIAAHKTSLTSVETDDAAIFFRYFDGFFLYGFFLAFAEEDYKHVVDPDARDYSPRDFAWLRAIWRRNLVFTGRDRVVAKLFSAGARMPRFLKEFPDARVLYMVRDPVQALPSTFSLMTQALESRFGFWSLPERVRNRWFDRLYRGLVELMQRFHDDWAAGRIPRDQVMVVPFPRLMQDFDGLMGEMLEFLDIEPSTELLMEINAVAARQRNYKSRHSYDLAQYGLDEERIRKDCAFVYETFLCETPAAAAPPTKAGQ